jgi:hypothetical protein
MLSVLDGVSGVGVGGSANPHRSSRRSAPHLSPNIHVSALLLVRSLPCATTATASALASAAEIRTRGPLHTHASYKCHL